MNIKKISLFALSIFAFQLHAAQRAQPQRTLKAQMEQPPVRPPVRQVPTFNNNIWHFAHYWVSFEQQRTGKAVTLSQMATAWTNYQIMVGLHRPNEIISQK